MSVGKELSDIDVGVGWESCEGGVLDGDGVVVFGGELGDVCEDIVGSVLGNDSAGFVTAYTLRWRW
jgi:hypothetical protein